MSVHGEYERALENLILHLRPLPGNAAEAWIEAFSALRLQHQPDLSTAARNSLDLVGRLESDRLTPGAAPEVDGNSDAPRGNILRESAAHLRAHCEAILGVSSLDRA